MTVATQQMARAKADRALDLHDKGIAPSVIAERLGVSRSVVSGMLQRARQRREKAKQEENA